MSKQTGMRAFFAVFIAGLMAGCLSISRPGQAVDSYRPRLKRNVMPEKIRPKASQPVAAKQGERRVESPAGGFESNSAPVLLERSERVLRKGDRLQVTIYAPPQPFTSPYVVDEDGRINVPLIGAMVVAGKSCAEAQRTIENNYIDQKIYKTVTVIIVPPESEYAVSGEVVRPGPFPLSRDLTVLQALGRAGRYTEFADKTKVFLIRNNDRVGIDLDEIRDGKRRDVVIIPGDVIEVPRSKW